MPPDVSDEVSACLPAGGGAVDGLPLHAPLSGPLHRTAAGNVISVQDELNMGVGMGADFSAHVVSSSTCPLRDGCHDGSGTFDLVNSNRYTGEVNRGKLHGIGTLTWKDAVSYSGTFTESKLEGTGCYTWPDGGCYAGDIVRGRRHGKGTYTKGNVRYQGEWREGKKHGLGSLYFNQAMTHFYEGEFEAGMKHGWGRMQYSSGSISEGQWVRDKMCGYGAMQWVIPGPPTSAATALQTGAMVAAAENAAVPQEEVLSAASNPTTPLSHSMRKPPLQDAQTGRLEKYEGQWVDGKPHGYGTYTWQCKGRPRHPTTHASAALLTALGSSMSSLETPYHGENFFKGWFHEGKRHGKGILCLGDGTVFEGVWQNNVKEGNGLLMHTDGSVDLLSLRGNVIEAKRILVQGMAAKRTGDVKTTSNLQGVTLNDFSLGDPIGLGIAELLDCPEEDKASEFKQVKDLLTRQIPELRLIYRFYAMVGPPVIVKTPSHEVRLERQRRNFEKALRRKAELSDASGCLTETKDLARAQASAEEAAFSTTPAFIERCSPPVPHRHMSRREVLIEQLHGACQEASAGAARRAAVALQAPCAPGGSSPPEEKGGSFSPLPAAPALGASHRPAPQPPNDEAPSTMKLHQLWVLLREAGVVGGDLTVHRCNRIIAPILRKQPQEGDDLQWLDFEGDSGAEDDPVETASALSAPTKGTKACRARTPAPTADGGRSRRSSKCSSDGVGGAARPSSAGLSKEHRNGLVAKVRSQQRGDPDDPQTSVMFPALVQCLVKIAHVKAKHTPGHAYSNASKSLSLCDRVNWLFTTYLHPLVDALTTAAASSAGPALCLPKHVQLPAANLSHKTPQQAQQALRRVGKRFHGASTLDCTANFSAMQATFSPPPSAKQEAEASSSRSISASSSDSQESYTSSEIDGSMRRDTTTKKSSSRTQKPAAVPPVAQVVVADKPQACLSDPSITATVTSTSVASEPSTDPVVVFVESYRSSASALPCHDHVCLGLVSKPLRIRELELDTKHQRAWVQQQDCADTVEEWRHQQRRGLPPDPRDAITPTAVQRARETLASLDVPHRLPTAVPLRILLRTRPVAEALAAHSDTLIALFRRYARQGAVEVRDLIRLLHDFDILCPAAGGGRSAAPAGATPRGLQVARAVCAEVLQQGSKSISKEFAEEMQARCCPAVAPEGRGEAQEPLLQQSISAVLRACLWVVLGIDADAHCQLRTRGEMLAWHRHLEEVHAQRTSLVPPPEPEVEEPKKILPGASMPAADVIKVDPVIRARLVARDEVKVNPAWFPPPPTASGVTDTWGLVFANLPLVYDEFLGMLATVACLAYTATNTSLPTPRGAINSAYDEMLPEKVARLLAHIDSHPALREPCGA